MMEFNKSVSNPMLMGCIQLMKAEDTPEHRSMFVDELVKASFQAPAIIEPAPVQGDNGELVIASGSRVQFPMLMTKDGKKFFMGFTDPAEYRKWAEQDKNLPCFVLKFDDYANMLFRKDAQGNDSSALGIIINPVGDNVVIPREMVAGIIAARTGQLQQMAAQRAAARKAPEENNSGEVK